MDLSFLPTVNAALNCVATVLLVIGFVCIRQKKIAAHRAMMISAFAVSALFLVLYVAHKAWKAQQEGALHTTFNYDGWIKAVYLVILLTHLVLAMAVPVFAIALMYLGFKRKDATHRKVARWGFPIWLYVSVTGVVIYVMLYPLNAPPG